ncbi:MAG TPA: DUF2934 domain-containing protein [Blastocatellia bacterium]|nr:DUF2934 domain-containing protein [Blastocatellia bacterium]
MTRESIEELRARLLRDPEVQTMIRMRAYEIYRIRGQEPGRQAEDWFQAQGEVLEFLIEEESRQSAEDPQPDPQLTALPTDGPESLEEPSRPVEHTAGGIESETALGVWSATEPDSAKLAPAIGKATEFQTDGPKQSAKKSASPRKPKAKAEGSAAEGTAKKTTRRASAKKDAGSPKPKRTRKKSEEPNTAGNE